MIANYHTHTWRCNHASGSESEYVTHGLDRGLKILGFSDHTPYPFPEGYYSTFRMRMDQLAGYISTVQGLQKQYSDKISIFLGLEAEYYPKYFPELRARLKDTPMQYLILGQHFVGNEIGTPYSGAPTADKSVLGAYCRQCMEAFQQGCFSYLAHPDLIHYVGPATEYRKQMRQLIQEAKSCGIPLEMNFLGISEDRQYPRREFWEMVAEEQCPVVFGCDAHTPSMLSDCKAEEKAKKWADDLHLHVLEQVELRPLA